MSQLSFAYRALVRVYMEDMYNPPKLSHETLHEEMITDSFAYDGCEEREFILDGMDWDEEGYFSIWVVGNFVWSTDYFGDVDLDVEPDVQTIRPASMQEMETVTGFTCYEKPQSDNIQLDGMFKFL